MRMDFLFNFERTISILIIGFYFIALNSKAADINIQELYQKSKARYDEQLSLKKLQLHGPSIESRQKLLESPAQDARSLLLKNRQIEYLKNENRNAGMLYGGSSGAGGGGAVACFENSQDISDCVEDEKLKVSCYDRVKKLVALEIATPFKGLDGLETLELFHPVNDDIKDWRQYLQTVLNSPTFRSVPQFQKMVYRYIDLVAPNKWPDEDIRRLISDVVGQYSNINGYEDELWKRMNCTRVQIAKRISVVNETGEIKSSLSYNHSLFNRLGTSRTSKILNQAAIVLHEALYWMDFELNENDSSTSVRNFVQTIFSCDHFQSCTKWRAVPYRSRMETVTYWLRIYRFDQFFLLDDVSRNSQVLERIVGYQKLIRLLEQAYISVNMQYGRTTFDSSSAKYFGEVIANIEHWDRDPQKKMKLLQAINQIVLKHLNEVEAFLLMATDYFHFYAPYTQSFKYPYEALFYDGDDGVSNINKVCRELKNPESIFPIYVAIYENGNDVLQKAIAYCDKK